MLRQSPLFAVLLTALLMLGGCAGPAGEPGPQGPPGADGTDGTSGATGPTGATGTMGATGNTGANGDAGPPGPQGDAGRDLRFVGPGLTVKVLDAGVVADGGTILELLITDTAGRGLDRTGIYTEGAVSLSLVLGWVDERADGLPLQYVSYTRRNITFDGGTFPQNAADTGGAFTELTPSSGRYLYRFGTPVVPGVNANKTHSVGIYHYCVS